MDLHDLCHVEIRTRDLSRAKAFYGKVFDWKLQDAMEGYAFIDTGDLPGGGLYAVPDGEPLGVLGYVLVADCTASARRAAELGARLSAPKAEVPGFGWYTRVADPWGNELGLWQPAGSDAPAPQGSGENNFCWFELCAPSLGEVADYYERLFGWKFELDPGHFRYYAHTHFEGKALGVGLLGGETGQKMGGTLGHVYAEDLVAARAAISAAGGRVVLGPKEIPHVGFFATFVDPEGNRLAVFSETPPP